MFLLLSNSLLAKKTYKNIFVVVKYFYSFHLFTLYFTKKEATKDRLGLGLTTLYSKQGNESSIGNAKIFYLNISEIKYRK